MSGQMYRPPCDYCPTGGARAVGIASGPRKCAYVKEELGLDAAIDHHKSGLAAELAAACPGGIDAYFENVGGAIWQAISLVSSIPTSKRSAQQTYSSRTGLDSRSHRGLTQV
jgi:threonine dehydrogenase-like Zn-dependent dehydrogenase